MILPVRYTGNTPDTDSKVPLDAYKRRVQRVATVTFFPFLLSYPSRAMASFENKVVILTGCSSGIGLATALLFLSRQAKVFGIDISPFKHELDSAQTSNFSFHQVDLTKPNAADEAVAACVAKFGPRIDVLANVAGIMDAFGSVDTVKEAEWDRVLSVNLTVPVRMMAAVIPSMKEHGGGAIVNVASKASLSGAAAGVAYTASKHGLAGATKNVAWRFHTEGISGYLCSHRT